MKKQLKSVLRNYLNAGFAQNNSPDTNRKALMVNLLGLFGVFITGTMGTVAIQNENKALAIALYLTGASYVISHFLQRFTGNKQIYSFIILYSMLGFMLYLVHSGGVNNTGPLWIFMAAPVALFFDGLKRGLANIGVFTFIIAIMLFYPNDLLLGAHYSSEFKFRLMFSFLSVTFLSAYYEYSRQRSFEFMHKISMKFEQMAKYDPLTQLPNRREAMDKLEYEYRRIERNLSPVALILCDVDHFKKVNDIHGNAGGDEVLIKIARLFRKIIRKQDTVVRWGGEEFLFILPQTNSTQALIVAKKLRDNLASHDVIVNDRKVELTLSMGISEVNVKTTIDDAIKHADNYREKAKENGRNQFQPQPVVFQSDVTEQPPPTSMV